MAKPRRAKTKAKTTAKPRPKAKAKAKQDPKPRRAKPVKRGTSPSPKRKSRAKPAAVGKAGVEARQFEYVLVPSDDIGFARGSVVIPQPVFEAPQTPEEQAPWPARVETPFAERAAGAGQCAHCHEGISRGEWQVVVTDDGATIHPGCTFAWTHEHLEDSDADDWMAALVEHLSDADRAELLSQLTPR